MAPTVDRCLDEVNEASVCSLCTFDAGSGPIGNSQSVRQSRKYFRRSAEVWSRIFRLSVY